MIFQGKARYPVREVVLHTAAVTSGWHRGRTAHQMAAEIRKWHLAKNWSDIGYHFVVAPDGSVVKGRPLTKIGAHVKERNRGTIGICMVNVNTHRGVTRFEDYFTEAQRRAVKALIAQIAGQTDLTRVSGHNDYTNRKECPGFKVYSSHWLPSPPSPAPWPRFLAWLRGGKRRA